MIRLVNSRAIARISFLLLLLNLFAPRLAAEAFVKPDALQPDITFWKKVYTEISTTQGFIHDDRKLNIIYETLELKEGISRRSRDRLVNARKRHYRDILSKLGRGSRKNLNEEAARVLALWPEGTSRKEFRAAAKRLRFQLGQSNKFRAGLIRSGRWMPHIRATMHREGLPLEITALPHVESSFNPSAYSYVGAAGMWQFTRSTGRRYMRVDHVVDERLDPFISTEAAAKLLKHNYSVTGSWPLAITAYNHGVSGMRRAIKQTGGTDVVKILRKYRSRTFKFASRNFYVAFLAAVEVHNDAEIYFGELDREPADYSETVTLPTYVNADRLAKSLDVKKDELRRMNPALRPAVWSGDKLAPKGYKLRVPVISESEAAVRIAKINAKYKSRRQLPDLTYRVRRGDTLSEIADRYGVRMSELRRTNNLRSSHFIRTGQTLRLPKSRRINVPTRELVDGTYRVQRGDTLSQIADAFGVPQQQLLTQNNLQSRHRIYVGQVLNVSAKEKVTETGIVLASVSKPEPPVTVQEDTGSVETAPAIAVMESTPATVDEVEPTAEDVPIQPAGQHPPLSADPANYLVQKNNRIIVQAAETLGHYADWLQIRTQELRRLNRLKFGRAVILGSKLKIDLSRVDKETFEARRLAYHRNLQEAYFAQYRITGVEERKIQRGDSIWELTHQEYRVPLWLFRQYNPDVDFHKIKPGSVVLFPKIEQKALQG